MISEQQRAETPSRDSSSDDDGPERERPTPRKLLPLLEDAGWTQVVSKRARRKGPEQKGGGATVSSATSPSPAVQADAEKLKQLERDNTILRCKLRELSAGQGGQGA